jgi:hypothetical protein
LASKIETNRKSGGKLRAPTVQVEAAAKMAAAGLPDQPGQAAG